MTQKSKTPGTGDVAKAVPAKAGAQPRSPMSDHAGGSHFPHEPKVQEERDATLHDLKDPKQPARK